MTNIVPDLRAANARARSGIIGLGDGALYAEAADEIERLRDKILELEMMRRLDAQIQAHVHEE